MPVATTNAKDTERFDLKSAPPDGFIVLRRMNYGEFIKRREMLSGMRLEGKGKDAEAVMQLANEKVTQFEFARCIIDHNLEDETGRKLNLSTVQDFSQLDPRIGQEIGDRINEMNQFHSDDEEGNPDSPVVEGSDEASDDASGSAGNNKGSSKGN